MDPVDICETDNHRYKYKPVFIMSSSTYSYKPVIKLLNIV